MSKYPVTHDPVRAYPDAITPDAVPALTPSDNYVVPGLPEFDMAGLLAVSGCVDPQDSLDRWCDNGHVVVDFGLRGAERVEGGRKPDFVVVEVTVEFDGHRVLRDRRAPPFRVSMRLRAQGFSPDTADVAVRAVTRAAAFTTAVQAAYDALPR